MFNDTWCLNIAQNSWFSIDFSSLIRNDHNKQRVSDLHIGYTAVPNTIVSSHWLQKVEQIQVKSSWKKIAVRAMFDGNISDVLIEVQVVILGLNFISKFIC